MTFQTNQSKIRFPTQPVQSIQDTNIFLTDDCQMRSYAVIDIFTQVMNMQMKDVFVMQAKWKAQLIGKAINHDPETVSR